MLENLPAGYLNGLRLRGSRDVGRDRGATSVTLRSGYRSSRLWIRRCCGYWCASRRTDLRPDILEWLAGASIPPERRELLGSRLALDEEDGAWRALQALLHLGQVAGVSRWCSRSIRSRAPSGWVKTRLAVRFLGALGEIYNGGGAALLLVFCQTQIWPEASETAPSSRCRTGSGTIQRCTSKR